MSMYVLTYGSLNVDKFACLFHMVKTHSCFLLPSVLLIVIWGPISIGFLTFYSFQKRFATLWTVACQVFLSVGFSRQEYWSGLPCPPPGDLPDQEIKSTSLMSPALAGVFFILETLRKLLLEESIYYIKV